MKRMIYAALAAVLMISACDSYHPYYDGQQFRIYHYDYGVIEADGVNMESRYMAAKEKTTGSRLKILIIWDINTKRPR